MTLEIAINKASENVAALARSKDCYVTFPDCAVFFDTDLDVLREYAERKKLSIVIVKQKGKINTNEIDESVRQNDTVVNDFVAESKKGKSSDEETNS